MLRYCLLLTLLFTCVFANAQTPEKKQPLFKFASLELSAGTFLQSYRQMNQYELKNILKNPPQLSQLYFNSQADFVGLGGITGSIYNLTAGFNIRANNSYNNRHVFGLGLVYYQNYTNEIARYIDETIYSIQLTNPNSPLIATIDSIKQTYIYGYLNTKNILANFSYTYTIKPERKFSFGFSTGIGIGGAVFSQYNLSESVQNRLQITDVFDPTTNTTVSLQNTFFYPGIYSNPSVTSDIGYAAKRPFIIRPYVSVLLNYRLSKTIPGLSNMALYLDVRGGAEQMFFKGARVYYSANASYNIGLRYTFATLPNPKISKG